jgi:uncharacterized damage-inducible protein DinB
MSRQKDDAGLEERLFLAGQRTSVLAIVDGLDEGFWHRPAVPSGWTVAGIVSHLGSAERFWFQHVVLGQRDDLPWDEGLPPYDPTAPLTCARPSRALLAYYREQCDRSDAVLDGTALSARPLGRHGIADLEEPTTVRWVVLHMIEETAAHSGHLEIARELLDGKVGLGNR